MELEKRGKRAPATAEARLKLLEDAHAKGHFGRQAIFRQLYEAGWWWPALHQDIVKMLLRCEPCIQFNVAKRGFHPAGTVTAARPWDHVQVDLATGMPMSVEGFTALMVVIDVFTGFVVLRPLASETADEIAEHLKNIFMLLGVPRTIQSDRGPQFVSAIVQRFKDLLNTTWRFAAAYNPRTDGKVERSISTIKNLLFKLLQGHDASWPLFLDFVQYAYNTKISEKTASAPFTLMLTRTDNAFVDWFSAEDQRTPFTPDDEQRWRDWQEHVLAVIHPAIDARIKELSSAMRRRLDKKRKALLKSLTPGTVVYRIDPTRSTKVQPRYVGPYEVVRRTPAGTYVLRDSSGEPLDSTYPLDKLKVVDKALMDNIYVVEAIVGHEEIEPGRMRYLVKWRGYDEESWVEAKDFQDTALIRAYHRRR